MVIRERQVIRGLPVIPDPRDQLVIQETPRYQPHRSTPDTGPAGDIGDTGPTGRRYRRYRSDREIQETPVLQET